MTEDHILRLLKSRGLENCIRLLEEHDPYLIRNTHLIFELEGSDLGTMNFTTRERLHFKRLQNYYKRLLCRQTKIQFNELFHEYNHDLFSDIVFETNEIMLVGHRGACGYEPENTLRAFSRAIEMGCGAIEFDVHVCKSGEVIVIHDESVDRTTNGKGLVAEKTLDELKSLESGNGEKIPTLNEVLDLVNNRISLNIELKGYGCLLPVIEILKYYFSKDLVSPSKIIVTSFIHQYVKEIREHLPMIKTGLLIKSELLGFSTLAEEADADFLVPHHKLVNSNVIGDAHSRGVKVMAWTVNEKEDIQRLKSIGIDGIITNYPDRFFD